MGLLFLGVPHQGMGHDCILFMTQGKHCSHLIEELSVDSPLLQRLHDDFMTSFRHKYTDTFVASYYETRLTLMGVNSVLCPAFSVIIPC